MKLWLIDTQQVARYDGESETTTPRIYEIEAEERSDYYVLDRTNPHSGVRSVSKSQMRTNFALFFTTEKEAIQELINLCTKYARYARERAAYDTKRAVALEWWLSEMRIKGV